MATEPFSTLLDAYGRPLFVCPICRTPLSESDLGDLGLRLPDSGESAEDYCGAELLQESDLRHPTCGPSRGEAV